MHEVQFMTAGQIMHRQAQFMIGICFANSNLNNRHIPVESNAGVYSSFAEESS